MRFRLFFLRHFLSSLQLSIGVCFAALLLLMVAHQANAQAVPAGTAPMGGVNPEDQPLAGQQLGTDLTLNQGIQVINAENESIDRFGLGFQVSGGAQTNFFGTETNPVTAAYTNYSADIGLLLHSNRTRFFVLYHPQYNLYPQYTIVNNFSQQYFQRLDYTLSDRSAISWNTTAARLLSINQYLPLSLGIGAIGVVVPTLQTQLLENSFELSDVATELIWKYMISTRAIATASLTSSWFLLVPADLAGSSGLFSERFMASGGDLKYEYLLTPQDTIGVEATPVYLYGLNPTGHAETETVEGLYKRQLTSTWNAEIAAGPLFVQSSGPEFGSVKATSYAVNASLTRQVERSQLSLTYQRAFVVSFLEPAQVSNEVGFNTHIPLSSHWILTASTTYVRESGSIQAGSGTIYGGTGQIAYQVASRMQLFAQFSRLSQSYNLGLPQPYAFSQNQFGAGLRFNLGNPITRGGVQ